MNGRLPMPEPVTVTEEVRLALAQVEFGQQVLNSPPDEESAELRELREMPSGDLEAEARRLQQAIHTHLYFFGAFGQVDGYSTQFRREYRLHLVRHVTGEERFEHSVADIHADSKRALRELEDQLALARPCERCGASVLFQYLDERFCDDCREQDPEC